MAGRFQPQGDDVGPLPPSNNLLGSVLVTIFCCLPFGIVAIIYGLQVGPKFKKGDEDAAQHAADMSEKWMYAGVGAAILLALIRFAIFLFNVFFGPKTGVSSRSAG